MEADFTVSPLSTPDSSTSKYEPPPRFSALSKDPSRFGKRRRLFNCDNSEWLNSDETGTNLTSDAMSSRTPTFKDSHRSSKENSEVNPVAVRCQRRQRAKKSGDLLNLDGSKVNKPGRKSRAKPQTRRPVTSTSNNSRKSSREAALAANLKMKFSILDFNEDTSSPPKNGKPCKSHISFPIPTPVSPSSLTDTNGNLNPKSDSGQKKEFISLNEDLATRLKESEFKILNNFNQLLQEELLLVKRPGPTNI